MLVLHCYYRTSGVSAGSIKMKSYQKAPLRVSSDGVWNYPSLLKHLFRGTIPSEPQTERAFVLGKTRSFYESDERFKAGLTGSATGRLIETRYLSSFHTENQQGFHVDR